MENAAPPTGCPALGSGSLAARWAMSLAEPAMALPEDFRYPTFKLGDWRARRSATAAIACQIAQQGVDELARVAGLPAPPRAVFDPGARAKDGAEAPGGAGRVKLGAASVGFWPSARRVGAPGDEERAPRLGKAGFVEHWMPRAGTALFGRAAVAMQSRRLARLLVSAWVELELERVAGRRAGGSALWARFERDELQKAPGASAAPSRPKPRL